MPFESKPARLRTGWIQSQTPLNRTLLFHCRRCVFVVVPKVRVPEFESRLSADTVSFFFVCRYLPAIGRFLIVVTFIEDSLRILTQWSDQLLYLRDYRQSMIPFLPLIAPIRFHRFPRSMG